MRKVLAATVAGAILVVSGVVYAAVSTPEVATAQESETTSEVAPQHLPTRERPRILEQSLEELVTEGVITQEQADAVQERVRANWEEWREEHPGPVRRAGRIGFQLGQWLADGVITAEELAELPDDHPIFSEDSPAAPYLEDGQITQEEFDQLRTDIKERVRDRMGPAEGDEDTES